jgi:CubicO group peptidase (beta-lactamase class C family)
MQLEHTTYDALAGEEILKPLGMTMSGTVFTDAMRAHLASGHDVTGKAAKGISAHPPGDHLETQITGQPAFPVFASAKDKFFLRVVDAQLDFERDAGRKGRCAGSAPKRTRYPSTPDGDSTMTLVR